MTISLAWRILTHQKGRTALALVGIFMAILLVFIQLGLFFAVPQGGMLLYDNMRFDLLLVSDQYEYQAQPGAFALSRLDRVRASPDVAAVTPIYFAVGKWKGGQGGVWPDVFVIGFDPASHVFLPESIDRQSAVLERPDTILVDSATRPIFGPLTSWPGRRHRRSRSEDWRAIPSRNRLYGPRRRPGEASRTSPACSPAAGSAKSISVRSD